MARTLLRYSQVRRTDRVDAPADDGQFALGRYFQANCQATDAIGHLVYVTGAAIAGVPQVTRADIKATGKYPVIGMLVEKSSLTLCLVQVFGEIAVSPAILTPGKPYWVGLDGLIVEAVPTAGVGERVATQVVGYAIDTGRLLINPERRPTIRVG